MQLCLVASFRSVVKIYSTTDQKVVSSNPTYVLGDWLHNGWLDRLLEVMRVRSDSKHLFVSHLQDKPNNCLLYVYSIVILICSNLSR